MVAERRVAQLKIRTAAERTRALISELERLSHKSYTSPAAIKLLAFIRVSADRLAALLLEEQKLIEEGILTAAELEIRSHRITQILPALLRTLRFVSGSEIDVSPGQLVKPLRRYVRKLLPGSDIIVSAKAELNYSIQEVAGQLRATFEKTVLEECCKELPEYLFAINIPSTEFQNVLIHAILSHELGHGLYKRRKIADSLLIKLQIDQAKLKAGLERILLSAASAMPPIPELTARHAATGEIAERISNWVEEIMCDLIGIHLFGPAFYFAYMNFLISFSRLDHASKTHPPIRLRMRYMTALMEKKFPPRHESSGTGSNDKVDLWPAITNSIAEWKDVCAVQIGYKPVYDEIASDTLNSKPNFDLILTEAEASVVDQSLYSADDLRRDINVIQPMFLNLIPVGEQGAFGAESGVDIASILNIGWIVYLDHLSTFRAKLPGQENLTDGEIIKQLQGLILKSLEISEIRATYNEIMLHGSGS